VKPRLYYRELSGVLTGISFGVVAWCGRGSAPPAAPVSDPPRLGAKYSSLTVVLALGPGPLG
jgi:hypothetical protein